MFMKHYAPNRCEPSGGGGGVGGEGLVGSKVGGSRVRVDVNKN